jgi:transcriptional regulator with GAF, ATPase, and Fis domain/tetratricopeptide (TPR) repeat protein
LERFAGRFTLLRLLGSGGMGSVYLALDRPARTECALKRLNPQVVQAEPDALRREFELLARVRHPAVVAVHEMGFSAEGTPFYTMEYVPGVRSDRAIQRGDWRTLCFVAAQVTHGLEALHAAHIVHGDLKPSNLLVIPGAGADALPAGVRLVDFGLAALLGEGKGHRGTRGFAAPEVVRGAAPDVAADLYGLGATLLTLITSKSPGGPSNSGRQASGSMPASSAPLEEAGAPDPLIQLILRLLSPAPAERPRDAGEVRRELERIHPAARRTIAQRLDTEIVVGRDRELARLERWYAQAPHSAPVALVTGEAGAGKSAVLGELAVRAAVAGHRVVRLSCASFDARGAIAAALLERVAADLDGNGADLELLGPARDALERGESPPESAWASLATALARFPRTLVLLDDGERIDPVSRAFVRQLAFHPGATALRWVWASRSAGRELVEEDRMLVEAGQAEHVHLGVLDRATANRLTETRLHDTAPAELGEFLWRRSGGHPGLLVETLRGAAASGALIEREVGLRVDAAALERAPVPESFEDALVARLAVLGPGSREAAEVLATFARPVARADVLAIAEARDEDVSRLVASGLARADENGRLALQPPALADRILAGASVERVRRLHESALERPGLTQAERFDHLRHAGRAHEALAAAAAANAEGRVDERLAIAAAELAEASAPDEAATWHERAGRALIDRGRHRAAIPYLERSLVNGAAGEHRAVRMSLMATAYQRAGRPQDVERVTSKALAENPPEHLRAMLLVDEAARLGSIGELERARETARQALVSAEAGGEPVSIGAAALTFGGVQFALGQRDEAESLARRSEEAYSRANHRLGRIRAIGLRAQVVGTRDVSEADAIYQSVIADARSPGLRLALDELLTQRGSMLVESGRWADGRDAYAEALRVAAEEGRPRAAAVAMVNLAQLDGLTGMPRPALRHCRAALSLTRTYLPTFHAMAWRSMAQCHRIAGRSSRAESAARRALSLAVEMGLQRDTIWSSIELGRQFARKGRWDQAAEIWSRNLDETKPVVSIGDAVRASLCGRAALRRQDLKKAQSLLAAIEQWLRANAASYASAHALQLRSELAFVKRDLETGLEGVKQTLEVFAALPAPPDRSQAEFDFARLAIDLGLAARLPVSEWLRGAAVGYEKLGDHRSSGRALMLLVENLHFAGARGDDPQRERDFIDSVSRLLDSLSDLRELSQRAMRLAVDQLGAERGLLLLVDAESGALNPVVEHGPIDAATRDEALGYSRRAVERVTRSGGSLLVTDAPTDPDAMSESVVHLGLRSIVCVPLYVAGKVVGAVYLDARSADAFSDADRGLLEGFAHLMAVAIEKSRGHEEVQRANELLVGENLLLRKEAKTRFHPENFIAMSSRMQEVLGVVERAAQTQSTVLITGENGTGKEEIARILHHSGRRAMGPFVTVNCGALTETLLESELFGILRNVATGVQGRDGRFVQANGGTLFLDEIGDMPTKQQVALLSAIAQREVTPVGGGRPIPVDVRIIAATNRELRRLVEEGAFREDLYFRLNVIPIEMPPLRDRKADIPPLAQHFVRYFADQQERPVPEISRHLVSVLMQSDWPGNVRELRNYVERVMAMTPGRMLQPMPLPRDLESQGPRVRTQRGKRLTDTLADAESRAIRDTLERCAGNQSKAARELGMTEQSLRYRMKKYAIERNRESRRTRKKSR